MTQDEDDIIFKGGFESNTGTEFFEKLGELTAAMKKYAETSKKKGYNVHYFLTVEGFRTEKRNCSECGKEYDCRIRNPLTYCDDCFPQVMVISDNIKNDTI